MLAKEAAMPLFNYREEDLFTDEFLFDLTYSIITSGLAMIVGGNTRMTSGAEHLISHTIDEYFPEKSTVHGLQVGWAHLIVEKDFRKNIDSYQQLYSFFNRIGLINAIQDNVSFDGKDFLDLVPLAINMRNRYTIFNLYIKGSV